VAGPRQAKRVIWYQLPPRGFWVWACGGLSVFDAVIIAAWTALNVIYVWQRVAFIVPLFKCALRFIWACRAMLQAADACHIPVCEHGTQQQTRVFDCAVCVLIFLFIFCSHHAYPAAVFQACGSDYMVTNHMSCMAFARADGCIVLAAAAAALGLFPDWNTWQVMLAACAPFPSLLAVRTALRHADGGVLRE